MEDIPPLKNVSLEAYADFVKKEIKKLSLNEYWVGGVSFGFVVVNLLDDEKHCKGIFAIEPYLGVECLKIPWWKKVWFSFLIFLLRIFNAFYFAWRNPWVQKKLLMGSSARYNDKIKHLLTAIDAKTFFETARLLLAKKQKEIKLADKPYVLVINKNDGSVSSADIICYFKKHASDLIIAHTTAGHYPKDITKQYFKEHIETSEIRKILDFIEAHK
jgi:hypothetical protein